MSFGRKKTRQEVQQGPQAGFGRPRVSLVLLELGESKTAGAGSVPRLISSPQKSFDNWHRQAVYRSSLLGRFSNALIDLIEFALFHFCSARRLLEPGTARRTCSGWLLSRRSQFIFQLLNGR